MIDLDKINLALFDLDGTLIPFPRDFLFEQTFEVFRELNIEPVSRNEMMAHFAKFDFFGMIDAEIRDTFMEKYWSRFQWNSYPQFMPIDGVLESLALLKRRGVKLAIVTSRAESREEVAENISNTGLLSYIDHIETRSSVPEGGSSDANWSDKTPQIREACQLFSVAPSEAIMAGDVPPDISSGKRENISKTIALLSGGIRSEILKEADPDYLLSSLADLSQVVS